MFEIPGIRRASARMVLQPSLVKKRKTEVHDSRIPSKLKSGGILRPLYYPVKKSNAFLIGRLVASNANR